MRLFTHVFMPFLRRAGIFTVLLFLSALTAAAQDGERFTVPDGKITVGAIIRSVQEQSHYVFAFDSKTFDTSRTVTSRASEYDLRGVLELIMQGTDYSYMVRDEYVVINSIPKPTTAVTATPQTAPRKAPRREYPSDVQLSFHKRYAEDSNYMYGVGDKAVKPTGDYYSDYSNPNLYGTISDRLPRVAVKANLFYGLYTMTPNAGIEIGLGPKTSLELTGGYNFSNWEGDYTCNKKHVHMMLQPEMRWWFCERFSGHFLGTHALFAKYNVSETKVPLLFDGDKLYDGIAFGAGVSYGYHLPLGKRWGLEFTAGAGIAYMSHEVWNGPKCSWFIGDDTKFYAGPTKLGISIVYLIK